MTILNLIMIIRMMIILIKCRQYVFQCLVPSARCHAIVGILIIEPIHLYLYTVMQCAGVRCTLTNSIKGHNYQSELPSKQHRPTRIKAVVVK